MTILSNAVETFRTRWTSRFVDTVTIRRTTDRGTFNASTHKYDSGTVTAEYSGAALIRPASAKGSLDQFGEQALTGKEYSIFVPHDAIATGDFQPEDEVTIDASANDPDLVGKTMRIVSQAHDSYLTRIELICRYDEGVGYVS